jgi:hypothetical protein
VWPVPLLTDFEAGGLLVDMEKLVDKLQLREALTDSIKIQRLTHNRKDFMAYATIHLDLAGSILMFNSRM